MISSCAPKHHSDCAVGRTKPASSGRNPNSSLRIHFRTACTPHSTLHTPAPVPVTPKRTHATRNNWSSSCVEHNSSVTDESSEMEWKKSCNEMDFDFVTLTLTLTLRLFEFKCVRQSAFGFGVLSFSRPKSQRVSLCTAAQQHSDAPSTLNHQTSVCSIAPLVRGMTASCCGGPSWHGCCVVVASGAM